MKSTPCDVIGKIAWKVHGNNYIAVSPYHVFCIKQLHVSSKNWWMSFCYLQQVLILFSIGFCTVPCALTRAKCTKTQTLNICMGRNIDLWTLPIPNCAAGYLSICPFSCQAARQWCALPMPSLGCHCTAALPMLGWSQISTYPHSISTRDALWWAGQY